VTQPFKICPQCQEPAHIAAASCLRCGRLYRTTAPPPMQQTQVVQPPPAQYQQPYPPPYPPPLPPYVPYIPYGPPPRQGSSVQPGSHSPMVAVLWSLLFLCAGQFYNKQVNKGLTLLVVAIVMGVCTLGLSVLITWPLALIDAYKIAERLNRGEVVGEWQSTTAA
jgi:TM2 domain-containing membrane protein YozV